MENQVMDLQYEDYVTMYHQSNNSMERAKIIKTIREYYNAPFRKISDDLFEVERTVYRLYQLNKLIPEFQIMLEEGEIRKRKASLIAKETPAVQYKMYRKYRETMIKADHEGFVQLLVQVAKTPKQ